MASLRSLGSKQIRILFGFIAASMLETHSVGSVTDVITFRCTNSSSFSFILGRTAISTRLGGCTFGFTVSSVIILYSPGSSPSPSKTSLNSSRIALLCDDIVSERTSESCNKTIPNAILMLSDKMGWYSPSITLNVNVCVLRLCQTRRFIFPAICRHLPV